MYQVWHQDGDNYRKAAEVNIGNVEGAAILSAFRVERWAEHPGIIPEPGEQRSTTFGDIIIDPQGVEYRLEMVKVEGYEAPGFTEVTTILEQGMAEWEVEQQVLHPEIPVTPEFDRILSEIEEGWQKSPPGWESVEGGARSAEEWERLATDKDQPPKGGALDQVLDHIQSDYDIRMLENYRPRAEGRERDR